MTRTIWLASYPKSGNTWFRMLVANLSAKDGKPVDINDLPERGGIASARGPFDYLTLIDSGLLTHDEIDCLRPRVYEELARGRGRRRIRQAAGHPAGALRQGARRLYATPKGEPLLAGRRGADGAIVIVRDPRDVAPSFANHNRVDIDDAIVLMNNREAAYCAKPGRLDTAASPTAARLERPYRELARSDRHSRASGPLRGFAGRHGRHVPPRRSNSPDARATDEDIARAVRYADFAELRRQEAGQGLQRDAAAARRRAVLPPRRGRAPGATS